MVTRTPMAAFVFASVLAVARDARATCRSTTGCTDPDGHVISHVVGDTCYEPTDTCASHPLAWQIPCVGFSVDSLGSALRHLSAEETQAAAQAAFDTWLGPVCDGASPSISVQFLAPSDCSIFEYNKAGSGDGNSNTIFYSDGQMFPECGAGNGDTIGDTCTTFELTGEIVDADIGLDSYGNALTLHPDPSQPDEYDLQSVLLHEVGHFLGMAHVKDENDVMYPYYTGVKQTLSPDDEASICAAYPPGRSAAGACTFLPKHGFSPECAADQQRLTCSAAGRAGLGGSCAAPIAALLGALVIAMRRRRAATSCSSPCETAPGA